MDEWHECFPVILNRIRDIRPLQDTVGKILLSRLVDASVGEFRILGRIRNSPHQTTELTNSILQSSRQRQGIRDICDDKASACEGEETVAREDM